MANTEFIRQVGYGRWIARWTRRQFVKRVLRRPSRITLPTGLVFTAPTSNQFGSEVLYTRADVDHGSERFLASLAKPTADFLDVGAHIGYYSLYLAPLVRRVYAFEPDPRNFPGLNVNLPGNATHVRAAVSAVSGTLMLDQSHPSGEVSSRGLPVDALTIDAFTENTPGVRPVLVKLDIQGHEMAALAGAEETVRRCQPVILTEFSRSSLNTTDALLSWLDDHGYAAFGFTPSHRTGRPPRLSPQDLDMRRVKMIFLVPPHQLAAFTA